MREYAYWDEMNNTDINSKIKKEFSPFSMSALIIEPRMVPLTWVPWPLDWSPVSPHPLYEYSMIFLWNSKHTEK